MDAKPTKTRKIMIKEDYVSFEVSKLLKEKGFNEPCRDFYRKENGKWLHRNTYEYNYFNLQMPRWKDCYSCPTHQMAMKWLREVHNLFIFPFPQRNTDSFWAEIYSIDKNKNEEDKWENLYCETIDLKNYPTYEDAVEAALKYSLENLI